MRQQALTFKNLIVLQKAYEFVLFVYKMTPEFLRCDF